MKRFWEIITTPVEREPVSAVKEHFARVNLAVTLAISGPFTLITLAGWSLGLIPFDTFLGLFLMTAMYGVGIIFCIRGRWRIGGFIPIAMFYLAAVAGNYIGGISVPAILLYAICMIMAAMTVGGRTQWAVFLVCAASYLLIAYAHFAGHIVRIRTDDTAFYNRVTIVIASILYISLLMRFIAGRYGTALVRAHNDRNEIALLALKNEDLYRRAGEELSARRRAEEELQRKNEELSSVNEEMTAALEELERTNAELFRISEEFKAGEERYRALSEQSLMAIAVVQDDEIRYTNRAFHDMSGYAPGEIAGMNLADFKTMAHPDDLPALTEGFSRETKELSGAGNFIFRARRKDGAWGWFELYLRIIQYNRKPAVYVVIVDRTAEKQNEIALKEILARYQAITDNAHEIIMVVQDDRIRYVNRWFATTSGYTIEESMAMHFLDFVHPDDRELVSKNYLRKLRKEPPPHVFSFRVVTKNGGIRWAETRVEFIEWDGRPAALNIILDITDRVKAEAALRESEERFRVSAVQTGEVIYDLNVETGGIVWTGAIERVTGYSAEEFAGIGIREWEEAIHPDDRGRVLADLERSRESAGEFHVEFRFRKRDGSYMDVEDHGVFMPGAGGKAQRMLGIMKDVSERVRARNQIAESLHEKEVLLKEVHHRVKNNFQVILSLLRLQLGKSTSDEIIKTINDTQNRIRAMSLVHEKLYQSQSLASINFGEYLKTMAAELFRGLCTDPSRMSLELVTEPVELPIGIAVPLGLAVSEVLTNTIKYAFPGEMKGTVSIRFERSGKGEICVTVRDNGIGMPDGFDPETADTLGFKLVYLLVRDQLRGRVTIEKDKGTAVALRLPVELKAKNHDIRNMSLA